MFLKINNWEAQKKVVKRLLKRLKFNLLDSAGSELAGLVPDF